MVWFGINERIQPRLIFGFAAWIIPAVLAGLLGLNCSAGIRNAAAALALHVLAVPLAGMLICKNPIGFLSGISFAILGHLGIALNQLWHYQFSECPLLTLYVDPSFADL